MRSDVKRRRGKQNDFTLQSSTVSFCISAWFPWAIIWLCHYMILWLPSCASPNSGYDLKNKVFQKFSLLLRKVILKNVLKILNCSTVILCINSLNKLPKVRTMETSWKPSFKNCHEIVEPQNNWVWKGPQKGFSPTSCSKKGEVRPGFSGLYLVASWQLSRMETA